MVFVVFIKAIECEHLDIQVWHFTCPNQHVTNNYAASPTASIAPCRECYSKITLSGCTGWQRILDNFVEAIHGIDRIH